MRPIAGLLGRAEDGGERVPRLERSLRAREPLHQPRLKVGRLAPHRRGRLGLAVLLLPLEPLDVLQRRRARHALLRTPLAVRRALLDHQPAELRVRVLGAAREAAPPFDCHPLQLDAHLGVIYSSCRVRGVARPS